MHEDMLTLPFSLDIKGLGVAAVDALSADDLSGILTVESRANPLPWPSAHFENSLRSHCCLGVKVNEVLKGYLILSFVSDEAEILLLVLCPSIQGMGVASTLLRKLVKMLTGVHSLFLEVRASNERAIQLYESVGFNQVGVRPNYYPAVQVNDKAGGGVKYKAHLADREDALIYAYEIFDVV